MKTNRNNYHSPQYTCADWSAMRNIQMSDYTVGEDCFDAVPAALASYRAKSVVLVGGKRALSAAAPMILKVLDGTDIEVLDTIVYGTDSTESTIATLEANPSFQQADVAFAIGGGKAIDTVKTAAIATKKTVFSVPTICSNCSSATAIAVVYHDDHSLKCYSYPDAPAHIFINPAIIANAPQEYFWAGIGDALSKQPEVEYATSAGNLTRRARTSPRAHLLGAVVHLRRAGSRRRSKQHRQ